jgi:hypothetical protein
MAIAGLKISQFYSRMPDTAASDLEYLGFKPPVATASLPATTKIIGFFSPNPWPCHVANNLLGISQTLKNKGDYVVDGEGNKINDPRLMQYVGASMLSVHMGTEEIPVRTMVIPTVESSTRHGFGGSRTVPEIVQKGTPKPAIKTVKEKPPTAVISPATQKLPDNPVEGVVKSQWGFGMSMEQARKLGLTGNARPIPEDHGVLETDGAPLHGAQIPEIGTPHYPTPKVKTDLSAFVQGEAIMPPISEEISDEPVKVAVDGFEMPSMPRAEPQLDEDTSAQDAADRAADHAGTLSSAAVNSETISNQLRFVDPETGKGFQYRSQLARFVRRKYPADKAESILSAYPASA